MTVPIISLAALVGVVALAIYRLIIQPAYLSPLAKIPNAHWSSPISPLWILYHRLFQKDTPAVHAAHSNLGPIIRLAPNELSVNSVDGGIRTVYPGGYEKGDWYSNVFSNYGVQPMFAMPDHGRHSKRKRLLSNIYAKSTLQTSASLAAFSKVLLQDRLLPRFRMLAKGGEPFEIYDIMSAITMDFVSAYVFGLCNSSNFVENPGHATPFLRNYKARQNYTFWPQELPNLTSALFKVGLGWVVYPRWATEANKYFEKWILSMCDKAEKTLNAGEMDEKVEQPAEDHPTVYGHLRNALLKEATKEDLELSVEQLVQRNRIVVASEMLDHVLAGFDTSGITLTYLAWELSRPQNARWQQKLRAEVAGLQGSTDPKAIDSLPVLSAILMETLRLHAAIPGNQPRITPENATLGAPGHNISDLPGGVRVQAQAWSLHRNASVFPDPETWNPGRWLEDSYASKEAYETASKEMARWFWAFGSGGRMCVGSNLAMQEMKAIVASIWGAFETVVHDDAGMGHNGGYIAEPVGKDGKYLVLSMRELEA